MGHLTEVIDENGHKTHYTYSPNGNLTKVEDAAGGVTRYEYDVMGNLIRITRSGQAVEDEVTQYEWNKNDQIIKMIDRFEYQFSIGCIEQKSSKFTLN